MACEHKLADRAISLWMASAAEKGTSCTAVRSGVSCAFERDTSGSVEGGTAGAADRAPSKELQGQSNVADTLISGGESPGTSWRQRQSEMMAPVGSVEISVSRLGLFR